MFGTQPTVRSPTRAAECGERFGETGRDGERRGETGRDWERLGETGRDWEGLGETGRDWEGLGETGRDWEGLGETGRLWLLGGLYLCCVFLNTSKMSADVCRSALSVNGPSRSVRSSSYSRETFSRKLVLCGEAYRRTDIRDNVCAKWGVFTTPCIAIL